MGKVAASSAHGMEIYTVKTLLGQSCGCSALLHLSRLESTWEGVGRGGGLYDYRPFVISHLLEQPFKWPQNIRTPAS